MRRVAGTALVALFRRPGVASDRALERSARAILDAVQREGERAVRRFSRRFDGQSPHALEIEPRRIAAALALTPRALRRDLEQAAGRIRRFAEAQRRAILPVDLREAGASIGHRVVPLERVGCYVPGGRFPLMSTALMTIVPAKVAGVREVVVCSPPRAVLGDVPDAVLGACAIAGADRVIRAGGVQAIGLLAYGVPGIAPVDRIVGPGNAWVACAKRLVAAEGTVGIDMPAGPSELLVVADAGADPERVALNLAAQAEHDPAARVALLTLSARLARRVLAWLRRRPLGLAAPALSRAVVAIARDRDEAARLANAAAPEHLLLDVRSPASLAARLTTYGSLFVGPHSDVALGDYVTGPNHTLPTSGAARFRGGLWVGDFLRVATHQRLSAAARQRLAPLAARLARAEGLAWHAASVDR